MLTVFKYDTPVVLK